MVTKEDVDKAEAEWKYALYAEAEWKNAWYAGAEWKNAGYVDASDAAWHKYTKLKKEFENESN